MKLTLEEALEDAEKYRSWLYKMARCTDCGKIHYPNRDWRSKNVIREQNGIPD